MKECPKTENVHARKSSKLRGVTGVFGTPREVLRLRVDVCVYCCFYSASSGSLNESTKDNSGIRNVNASIPGFNSTQIQEMQVLNRYFKGFVYN